MLKYVCFFNLLILLLTGCSSTKVKDIEVGEGWANNSVNTVIFRKNALVSSGDFQFIAYYDDSSRVILGNRKLNSKKWKLQTSDFTGNTKDAHNAISIALDGDNRLHASWDHHDNPLNYAVSESAFSTTLGEKVAMTGKDENKLSYPQFYNLKNGNLFFLYRSGQSGKGKLVSKLYNIDNREWEDLHDNLIDGEGERNAYWQASVDRNGTIHLSWVWRESWDVSTNHDMAYARSKDGGITWEKSNGERYKLPITASTAEYAWKIPQSSELINQTSMTADKNGNPYIVTYWTEDNKTDYQLIYLEKGEWKHENTNFRNSTFQLGGGGTKKIPISRPEILLKETEDDPVIYLLFRDEERGNKVSMAYHQLNNESPWNVIDLTKESVGEWEPNYDLGLWEREGELHVFVQKVTQVDGEGIAESEPTKVRVLEISNLPLK
ncbi:BNR repeat-containing protein [Zunongwangia endophytica]|uniref:BNR repeat-containing protein n=1 Tax=Zunongwangia endophytica TaxID=1808945 RepID=A0ABV8HE72_9FLAO|nr:BNR repeat-containing protein [Zunongwangia endophytica]MDN3596721.1 BNR repeat-containing protein [Zunongwangia endophytica]